MMVAMNTVVKIIAGAVLVSTLGATLGGCASVPPPEQNLGQAVDSYAQAVWDRTQDDTATCMEALGFTYQKQPYDKSTDKSVASLSPYWLTLGDAQAHGFGQVDAALSGLTEQSNSVAPSSSGDASDESVAYGTALYGDGSPDSGCLAQAEAQAGREVSVDDYPAIEDQLAVWNKIQADPRYAAFWASWSTCMAGVGITATDQDALVADFVDKAARLVTIDNPAVDPTTGQILSPPTPTIDMAAAELLRQQEVNAAVSDVQCLEPLRGQWEEIVSNAENG